MKRLQLPSRSRQSRLQSRGGWKTWLVCSLVSGPAWIGSILAEVTLDATKLPPPATEVVDFSRDVQPIFEARCYRCHGPERPKSRFRLDTREAALKGGEQGVDIVPGNSAKSPLIYYVARLVEDMEMPPSGKGEPLSQEQVALLRAWIDQDAPWTTNTTRSKMLFSIEPSFAWITVSGDRAQFREQWGVREGWSGGVQDFRFQDRTADGVKLDVEGRALGNQDNYRLKLNLEKTDLGFARMGFEEFRRYYDDTGGYYEPFGVSPARLGRDLGVDVGRAWFDVGLTLPNWPRIVLGYEYQFKDRAKSSLAWSDVTVLNPPGTLASAAIYPNTKDIEEHTHILKLDVSHEVHGARLEDEFRGEFFDLNTDRMEVFPSTAGSPPPGLTRYREDYNHFQAVNAFRMEKQLQDWLLLGGGYLYSKLDGEGGFDVQAFLLPNLVPIDPLIDQSSPIIIHRESHIGNLSSLWGPWEGLTLSAGLQNEWTHEDGFGEGLLQVLAPGQSLQHLYSSQRDKAILQETVGLRYTRIPFTVLFADARFRQEWIDVFELDQGNLEGADFLRDTDASLDAKEVRTGFTVSPWTRVSFEGSYRHRLNRTDYDHRQDTTPTPVDPTLGIIPGEGYPAFFRRRDWRTDEAEARVILHPATWVKTSLKYQLVASDFWTTTDSAVLLGTGTLVPGGTILAGNYNANIYSANATLTPWRRLNFSTTFAYSETRTVSGVNGAPGVAPYRGDIYSVLSTANVILNQSTDWRVSYTFSRADYRQSGANDALPLGIEYQRHGIITGLSRRFSKTLSAGLQYGFFLYDEPTSGGARDYTAHAIFGSLKFTFD